MNEVNSGSSRKWDVDFSLALHNRTGKYYIGRDLLAEHSAYFDKVYYWRYAASLPPGGLTARVLGRLLVVEDAIRERRPLSRIARFRSRRRMIHLDPATVVHARITPEDLLVCHDLGPITHPDLFHPGVTELYHRAFREIARVRPRIVCVSQATLDAFRRLYGDVPDQHVIYPAIRIEVACGREEPVDAVQGRYFLTVGSVGRRKNQALTIAAFARSGLAAQGWSYVLCGGREPGQEEVAALAAETQGVKLLPYVSDAQLNWLYRNAGGFVLASRLEGFGIPVAEAVARGLVPLVSRGTVLEEVAGAGAVTADCLDVASIAEGLLTLAQMSHDERKRRLAALGPTIGRFTPEAFAAGWRQVLDGR
jgi:glycosyltransferase involved in cell wall biosynthesis